MLKMLCTQDVINIYNNRAVDVASDSLFGYSNKRLVDTTASERRHYRQVRGRDRCYTLETVGPILRRGLLSASRDDAPPVCWPGPFSAISAILLIMNALPARRKRAMIAMGTSIIFFIIPIIIIMLIIFFILPRPGNDNRYQPL
ncbi:hypothetical protein J6590_000949 [Homalodisca vitripennis]|nr:hypothetical protein J6590_000949 [Homalodisca vitripennis]